MEKGGEKVEEIRYKLELMELINQHKWDEAIQKITEMVKSEKTTNAYYLNELIKTLVKLKLDWEVMKEYEKEHYSKLAYVFASRL